MVSLKFIQTLALSLALCSLPALSALSTLPPLPTSQEINTLIQREQLDDANKKLDIVILAKPESALAFFYKSLIYFKQGSLKESEFYLKLAEKKEPHINFAKNKEMYFQYRKDLYEVLARPQTYESYKKKDYSAIISNISKISSIPDKNIKK